MVDIDRLQLGYSAVEFILGQVPYAGKLLSKLVGQLWPSPQEDVWGEIKDTVEQAIGEKIAANNYDRVAAVLGDKTQGTGLIGVIDDYLDATLDENSNGQDKQMTWLAAHVDFVSQSGAFEQKDCEILLLPLFAQMANLHLALLRDGVLQGYCNYSEFEQRLETYMTWANQWAAQAIKNVTDQNKKTGQFNPVNDLTRYMQVAVLDVARLWPYFDTKLYPNPNNEMPLSPEIFYSAMGRAQGKDSKTGAIVYPWAAQAKNYVLPSTRPGYLTGVNIYSLRSSDGGSGYPQALTGTVLQYDSGIGSTEYIGVPQPNAPPPGVPTPDKDIGGVGKYSLRQLSINRNVGAKTDNPIIEVDGNYSAYKVHFIRFHSKDETATEPIPSADGGGFETHYGFDMKPPEGYYMSSIWMPKTFAQDYLASDTVIGFQRGVRNTDSQLVTYDPQKWIENVSDITDPNSNWKAGYSVQYTVQWVYTDPQKNNATTTSNAIPWCDPISSGFAMPTLVLPPRPDGMNVTGINIWRKFAGKHAQLLETVPASTKTWPDEYN